MVGIPAESLGKELLAQAQESLKCEFIFTLKVFACMCPYIIIYAADFLFFFFSSLLFIFHQQIIRSWALRVIGISAYKFDICNRLVRVTGFCNVFIFSHFYLVILMWLFDEIAVM